ncbi:MAG TPA: hypothetical protein VI757_09900 [Bacteroidia bacterium]|nr:hypothetical protein [Bacteroidia bacterium]
MIEEKNEIVEYSISPTSGRIKKKIRYRKKRSFFSRRRLKRYFEFGLLIMLVVILVVSILLITRPQGEQQNQMRVLDKKGKEK